MVSGTALAEQPLLNRTTIAAAASGLPAIQTAPDHMAVVAALQGRCAQSCVDLYLCPACCVFLSTLHQQALFLHDQGV